MKYRSTGEVAGGARGGLSGIAPTLTYQPMSRNADYATENRSWLANRLEMEARVRRFLADFAQHCIDTVPATDRGTATHWLQDMKRPEGKRNQKFVEQLADLIEVGAKSSAPVLLSEGILAETMRVAGVVPGRAEGYRAETETQATHDVAQAGHLQNPTCPTAWQRAMQTAMCAMSGLRHWITYLHAAKPSGDGSMLSATRNA